VTWPDLLDEMEARLGAHARALRDGAAPPDPVVVPTDIGPLPVDLRERAERLLVDTRRMEAEVDRRRSALLDAQRRVARSDAREPAAYVDARA